MPQLIPPHLHPLVVHFPIVLIPLAALLATYAAWRREAWTKWPLLILVGMAAVSAFVADRLGDGELEGMRGTLSEAARQVAQMHNDLATYTVIASFVVLGAGLLFHKRIFFTRWTWAYAAALWLLFALIAVAAWYGGALVYEYGVGVP